MDKSVYCTVRWSNHSNNVNRFLSVSYAEEKYTDVALACEGHLLKAHKIILAGCSPYFENMFSMYSVQNLCVAVEGIAYPILQLVLEFMYSGEIRVKHSELENLVKAGVQLKVKGLDAIKLNDLTRGAERTTVIARPTDSTAKLGKGSRLPVTSSPSSVSKLPQKLSEPVPHTIKSSPKRIEPSQQGRLKLQKPHDLFPGATSTSLLKLKQEPVKTTQENSKSPEPSDNSKAAAENHKPDKESPVSSPSKPATSSSESKKKVGQWLDSLKLAEKKEKTEEVQPRQTRKRAAKPRAPRAAKEPKISRALSRLQGSNGVEKVEESEEKEQEDVQNPTSVLSPSKESTVETDSELEKPTVEREQKDVTPIPIETDAAVDSDKSNLQQDEEKPTDIPSITKPEESVIPEKGEILTTRSRTIKKPARLVDAEFEFEQEVVQTKKRRSRKADGEDAKGDKSLPTESKTSSKRRKPGAFFSFSSDFKDKLMEEYPGETRKEISKRLGLLWQNLDQATKLKYLDPDTRPNKNK